MTFNDLFEELWPGSSPDARDALLWITPFPFVDGVKVLEVLRGFREKYGPNISDAIDGEMNEFDEQFRLYREQERLRELNDALLAD